MKYFFKIHLTVFFVFFLTNASFANQKTAIIDVDYIIQNSNIGNKILTNINDLNKKNINNLTNKNNSLREIETAIKNKKNILSDEEFNNEVKIFQQKVKNFTNEKNKLVKEFNNFRKQELEKILKLLNPIINEYMKENSINILIDSKYIFMGNNNSNITQPVLNIINEKIK